MIIREAGFDDWNQLAALIEASNREMHTRFDIPDYTRAHLSVVFSAIRELGGVFVAEEGDTLVGYVAWISPPEYPPGTVEGLGTYILPEKRGEGIRVRLRTEAEEFHRKRGGKRVYGVAHNGNEAGLRTALMDGFEVVGVLVRKSL